MLGEGDDSIDAAEVEEGKEGFGAVVGRGGVGAPQGSASTPESHGFARYAGTGAGAGFEGASFTTVGCFGGCLGGSAASKPARPAEVVRG